MNYRVNNPFTPSLRSVTSFFRLSPWAKRIMIDTCIYQPLLPAVTVVNMGTYISSSRGRIHEEDDVVNSIVGRIADIDVQ